MESKNARLGLLLFCIYLLLYGGFVFINTFSAETMELMPIEGINLAIIYGFGLIVAALVLALIYGALCSDDDDQAKTGGEAVASVAGDKADAAKENA